VTSIEQFLIEIDHRWAPIAPGKIPLQVIGSAALMLQSEYVRGTKDGDVLETQAITPAIKERLLSLAGKNTDLHRRSGMYLDVVTQALPFMPQRLVFHDVAKLRDLKHFSIHALDIADVVVSKLKRFSISDVGDIREMVNRGLVDHKRLIKRFEEAVDRFSIDARIEDVPKVIKNLHAIERDYLRVPESEIDMPDWMNDR
jgi:hypothetical protein